jgi:hypothetical protein
MLQQLFPHYLHDPAEYAQAEAYWRDLWDELARFAGQQKDWQHPWLRTTYADGTPFQDGDPIFSAWSPARKLGVRIIQNEPQANGAELDYWHDVMGDRGTGEVQTLVISCTLSRQTANLARSLILSWMRDGKVSIYRPYPEGPLVVGNPSALMSEPIPA